GINMSPIRIAQIRTDQSMWDFKQAVMRSVRDVAEVYWDLYAAHATVKAIDEVLPVLEDVLRIQREMFRVKRVIRADVAKAESQLHAYRQQRMGALSHV